MASSRWKRFAFFERNTLSLASEVLEDLIPIGDAKGSRRSLDALNRAAAEANDSVSIVVSTAALPLNSKPVDGSSSSSNKSSEPTALMGMWSSLNACTALELPGTEGDSVVLQSQAQLFQEVSQPSPSSSTAVDGLVLVFVTSDDTERVHCFDVTLRCNPPEKGEKELEDMDGWRGYFAPLKGAQTKHSAGGASLEDRVISEHLSDKEMIGIRSIACCRASSGHRPIHFACISADNVVVCVDPHLSLSCRRPLTTPDRMEGLQFSLPTAWNVSKEGSPTSVDICPGIVAVGTDKGGVLILTYGGGRHLLRPYLTIPPPPSPGMVVVSVKLSQTEEKVSVFVAYRRTTTTTNSPRSTAGVCCYDMPVPSSTPSTISAPSARHDLDGRHIASSALCDAAATNDGLFFTVARPDGLYTYSSTQKVDVSPIDGSKVAICLVPPPESSGPPRDSVSKNVGSRFALIASTDAKSRRDAVDIYDSGNKLVAFHLLLSPGHTAVCAGGVTTPATRSNDGTVRNGRSSAVVFTSGGSLVTLTEKKTIEKVNLLVQKNMFAAAIFVAFADPSYEPTEITALYRRHAEYLYRKGDYKGAIEQYIHTIGSLEPSHIIFRYLDAPKIPLLVKYLEELKSKKLTTPVHNELLRTCYLKLNDPESAESISAFASRSVDTDSLSSIVTSSPKDALALICSFEAPEAAESLTIHGTSLARLLPRETAGLVASLCLGTYSPRKFSESAAAILSDTRKVLEYAVDEKDQSCQPYPVHLFAPAFMENSKMLRLILAHCNRNKCSLTPSLRRTLLELTLSEWNQSRRTGDTELESLRRKEAIASLTDSHCRDLGDYDALVIVQAANFAEGELLLYERLQMGPMLLSRYAKDGSEKARRQMLAMCQRDPEVLADVLGHFVTMVQNTAEKGNDSDTDDSEDEAIDTLEDIEEALALAKRQGVLPPVRIARILAGEGTGQFSAATDDDDDSQSPQRTVPLAVALDYVGAVLDDSRTEIARLKSEVEEYNKLCNDMEAEVEALLRHSQPTTTIEETEAVGKVNIEEMYSKVRASLDVKATVDHNAELSREAYWREMDQSDDTFQTIARYFAKGVIKN